MVGSGKLEAAKCQSRGTGSLKLHQKLNKQTSQSKNSTTQDMPDFFLILLEMNLKEKENQETTNYIKKLE